MDIEFRQLGNTKLQVPAMGIGTQSWGKESFGYGKTYTETDLAEAFKASMDSGINFFDTADTYSKGESERLLGKFIKADGRPVILASKFTKSKWFDKSPYKSPKDVLGALDTTLKNLGVEQLDLYQLHYPEPKDKINDYLDALAETVKSGKVKAIGVCNFSAERLKYACEYLDKKGIPIASNQFVYNLIFRHPEANGLFKTCNELNVSPIAIVPLAEGILTGKYRNENTSYPRIVKAMMKVTQLDMFGTGDPTHWSKLLFKKPYELQRTKLEPLFVLLEEIAQSHNATIVQVILNWLLNSHPRMIYIPGAKKLSQATDNLASLKWKMSVEEFNNISKMEREIWSTY